MAVQATYIRNAETARVVALAVRAHPLFRSPLFHGAIQVDQVVIADSVPTPLSVPAVHLGSTDLPAHRGSRAMDN